MNINKAREFFSAYYENTLDHGLKQTFERELQSDAQIQAEYRAFEKVMGELNVLRDAPVEIPFNLHDKICQRIDLQVYEQKRKAPSFFGGIWRSLALGSVAAVVIVGTFLALNSRGGDTLAAGSITSTAPAAPRITSEDGTVYLSVGAGQGTVEVREGVGGPIVMQFHLNGRRLKSPMLNRGAEPQLLAVSEGGSKAVLMVALPGAKRATQKSGEGSVADLAKAIAGYYGIPVEIQSQDLALEANWKFDGPDPVDSVSATVNNGSLSIEQRSSGVLCVIVH